MLKKIKVLHTEWSDGWGGQEIRTVNEMIAVREQGIEVYLACRDNATIKEKAIQNGIQVFILPFKGNTDLNTLFSLRKIIKENNIDIINTHSGKDTWVGGLAAKLAGAKFIRTRHLSNPIRSSRLNFINELADYIFTTGESVKNDMINNNRINPNKIISIPTGIDDELFDPNKYDRVTCRKEFNIQDDEIAIGIIAVLRQFKRHDLFVKAAKELIDKNQDKKLKFVIAGDGPQKIKIEKLIKELNLEQSFRMLGHVSKVPELLMALDIFTLTSDSKEGVPQSVMQALLMNKKVVATDAGSTRDLLNGKTFVLIKPNSLDEVISGLTEQIENIKRVDSRNFIISNFVKKIMVEKIITIYRKLI